MSENLSRKLIAAKYVSGEMRPGEEIALRMDQALLQDVLGTLVMLELDAMGVTQVVTRPSVQYIDHGLVQSDHLNADSHLFLKSACARFGITYSGPGNGISHPVHMERFGVPGQSLVGSDSHTTAAGSLGMLAIGAGGIEVALAMAGEPLFIPMPKIWGVEITGALPDWVSAKDVILELLRRHGVAGAKNCILEFYGEGLACLSAMDRHVIANMGTEMGATTTVFPSDDAVRRFLEARGRDDDFVPLAADPGCTYDLHDHVDLSSLEPLIALPSSPGNVAAVAEVAGEPCWQSYIGSSANPGYRDFAVVADIVAGRRVSEGVSLDINPSSRQVLETLIAEKKLGPLIQAGARLHQAGCNGCIGMGQAPAAGRNSLRTVTRNFPGRSGTREDAVFLCSPETAGASALTGQITDPRTLDMPYPRITEPAAMPMPDAGFAHGPRDDAAIRPALLSTDNTPTLPQLDPIPNRIDLPVILTVDDDISTDDIIPAGHALPYWSNVYATRQFAFERVDESYPAKAAAEKNGHAIVAGRNYGQGSSRENAALVPAIMGLGLVIAESFARIHWQNLVSFGVVPLTFADPADRKRVGRGDRVRIQDLRTQIAEGNDIRAEIEGRAITLKHDLSPRQRGILMAGGVINWIRDRNEAA
ncbi:aconitate hydratase [Profundibacterium mesophilum]|uniref:Aconitate hydratase 1 n=1 Tax=Profundibacterium mesophilum KAUST100406-0324 TaxID=1037889 RepID=A0A921NWK9_9RHOB|nr:aconitate hydratase [Profundibacterium mesophilum]KAF0676089.1 aconitate hydratase 1 [Profundibacterium mesophilum KAUST100406-0324]